jgi:tetratricopeptide (TPR) repeat protein
MVCRPNPGAPWPDFVRQVNVALQCWLTLVRHGDLDRIESERESLIQTLSMAAYMPQAQELAFELGLTVDSTMRWRGYWQDWHPVLLNLLLASQVSGRRAAQARLWERVGALYNLQGEQERATAAHQAALGIAHELGENGDSVAAWGLAGLIDAARRRGALAEALGHIQEALLAARRSGDLAALAEVYLVSASAYASALDWVRALEYAQMTYICWRRLSDVPGVAKGLHILGIIYRTIGRPAQAIRVTQRAAEAYRAIGSDYLLALLDVLLGDLYRDLDDWPNAEAHYRRAIEHLEVLDSAYDLAMARHRLGIAYSVRGRWKEAARCLQAALEDWRRLRADDETVSALCALGDMYARQGLADDAVKHLESALSLAEALPPNPALAHITAFIEERLSDSAVS